MFNKSIKYITMSDLHLGHPNNSTENIVSNLRYFFQSNYKIIKTLDIIFIAGDIFHKLLSSNSIDMELANEWLTELVMICKLNNIKLRILEGTPSHDWRQAKIVYNILAKSKLDVDFKYITTLHIEKMDDLGLSILYVPDEYKHDASETYKDVIKLMKQNNLTQVDIAIMHGAFNYQLPVKLKSSHNEADYLSIVKYYISVGHIHTPSVFDRILAQGSFDRTAQSEEEDKGCMLITISKDNKKEYVFLKNTRAMEFKTLRYPGMSFEDILLRLKIDLVPIKKGSRIRVIYSKDKPIKVTKTISNVYPDYFFKFEHETVKEIDITKRVIDVAVINSFKITKENVLELLRPEIGKHSLSALELNVLDSELHMVLNNL